MIKKKLDICVGYTFILIFKFMIIYLLYVLFILKIVGIFEKRKVSLKELKEVIFFIYSID